MSVVMTTQSYRFISMPGYNAIIFISSCVRSLKVFEMSDGWMDGWASSLLHVC